MKKRIVSIILSLVMLLSLLPVTAFADTVTGLSGSGTEGDPYLIGTLDELNYMAQQVNADTSSKINTNDNVNASAAYYRLTADISGFSTPIGTSGKAFSGTFDGDGHTVTLSISGTNAYAGLFGYVSGGTVKNVITAGSVSSTNTSSYVGGVCGYIAANGTILNCGNTGSVTGKSGNTGGVCGYIDANGTVANSYNTGTVQTGTNVGGVCGSIAKNGKLTNCYNSVTMTVDKTRGSVCGLNAGTITSCHGAGTSSAMCGGDSKGTATDVDNTLTPPTRSA